MKKLVSIIAVLTLLTAVSCGGGTGGGQPEEGGHVVQAKQIVAAATFAAIISTLLGTNGALIDFGVNHPTSPTVPDSGSSTPVDFGPMNYSTIISALTDNAAVSGSYTYTSSGDYATGATVTFPQGTVTHNHTVNSADVPSFDMGGTTYSEITYATVTDKPLTGEAYGTLIFTLLDTDPTFSSLEVTETGINADDLTVTLADGTSGTIDINGWTHTSALSDGDILTILPVSSGTVIYQPATGAAENYDCTNIRAALTIDASGEAEPVLDVGTTLACTCTNCS